MMAANTTLLQGIYEEAVADFEITTGKKLEEILPDPPQSLDGLRRHAEKEYAAFVAKRDKKNKKTLDQFMTGCSLLQRACEMIGTGSALHLSYGKAIFTGLAFLLKVPEEVSRHYDLVETALKNAIGHMTNLPLLNIREVTPECKSHLADSLAIIVRIIAHLVKAIRGRFRQAIKTLVSWTDSELANLDQKLERSTTKVYQCLTSEIHSMSLEQRQINRHVQLGSGKGILLQSERAADELVYIHNTSVKGTGDWLFRETAFHDWLELKAPLLWISGSPGTGKSYLAGSVVSHLKSRITEGLYDSDVSIGYFPFSKTSGQHSADTFPFALRALAYQISEANTTFKDHACSITSDVQAETVSSLWRKIFKDYFSLSGRRLFLVFDGLDETEDVGSCTRDQFLQLFLDLKGDQAAKVNISVVLLGRPHLNDSIRSIGRHVPLKEIRIEPQKTSAEMEAFLRRSIADLNIDTSMTLYDHVLKVILEKSEGMFLWAKLMFANLKDARTEDEIREGLERAPPGIGDIISHVLSNHQSILPAIEFEELVLILAWLYDAERPPTLAEIDAITKLAQQKGAMVMQLEKRLRERFNSLIRVLRDDGLSTSMLQSRGHGSFPIPYGSIPQATTVVLEHASIHEYFRSDNDHSRLNTPVEIAGIGNKASYIILKTCLQVFVIPEAGERLMIAQSLQEYGKTNWFSHFQRVSKIPDGINDPERVHVITLLARFLKEKDILRNWCRHVPSSFFTRENANVIQQWIESWTIDISDELPQDVLAWVNKSQSAPSELFLPLADIHSEEGLLKSCWHPSASLAVIRQIRNLIIESKTSNSLEITSGDLECAAKWRAPHPNARWHSNLATCLMEHDFTQEASDHFKAALQIDTYCTEARSGIALLHRRNGNPAMSIAIEKSNLGMLKNARGASTSAHQVQLARIFETIAQDYSDLNDPNNAIQFWRKAAATQEISDEGITKYLVLLSQSARESRSQAIMSLLQLLNSKEVKTRGNRLIGFILRERWPSESDDNPFLIMANAVHDAGQISWFEEIYEAAMAYAPQHISIIALELCLMFLHKKITKELSKAEHWIEDIGEIASMDHEGKIPQFEWCRTLIAQEFCQLCVRNAAQDGFNKDHSQIHFGRIALFHGNPIRPTELYSKIFRSERTSMYFAVIQSRLESCNAAINTLRPMLEECRTLVKEQSGDERWMALEAFTEMLVAVGLKEAAIEFFSLIHRHSKWICSHCPNNCPPRREAAICELCLLTFCNSCASLGPMRRGFCVERHSFIRIRPRRQCNKKKLKIRGQSLDVEAAMDSLMMEWGLAL